MVKVRGVSPVWGGPSIYLYVIHISKISLMVCRDEARDGPYLCGVGEGGGGQEGGPRVVGDQRLHHEALVHVALRHKTEEREGREV